MKIIILNLHQKRIKKENKKDNKEDIKENPKNSISEIVAKEEYIPNKFEEILKKLKKIRKEMIKKILFLKKLKKLI